MSHVVILGTSDLDLIQCIAFMDRFLFFIYGTL